MKILHLNEIQDLPTSLNLADKIEQGFVAYSQRETVFEKVD